MLALLLVVLTTGTGCGQDDSDGRGRDQGIDVSGDQDMPGVDQTDGFDDAIQDGADATLPDNRIDAWTYLIVTTEEMQSAFEELAHWRRQTGLATQVVTMDQVLSAALGRDPAEQLRNYLKAAFEEHQIEIVLLGGDTPLVPHRDVYAYAHVDDIFETAATTPSELYFSDLDGDWDDDGDGHYGEFEDELEMMPDVAVGRVPARTADQAEDYVAKILEYEQAVETDYQHKVLYLAEPTGWYDVSPCPMFELWTGQLFWAVHEIQRLYDDLEQCPGGQLNTLESQMEAINQGVGMVIHLGHGSEQYLAEMSVGEVAALHNGPRYNLFFSCACLTGNFGWSMGLSAGESYVLDPDGGGVAYVGNTDIGIGFPPGGFFVKEVVAQLLDPDPPRLGQAFATSRQSFITGGSHSWTDGHPDRYTQFVVVLLGDPGIRMWQAVPRPIQLEVSGSLATGEFLTVSVDDGEGSPVSGATVTLYQPEHLLVIRTTDESGVVTVTDVDARPGDLIVTASGTDLVPEQTTLEIE